MKPAWAATATRGRRGRRSRPNRQGRARGNRARRRRAKPTPSSARGTHTETPLEAKTTECGTLPASEPTGRPKDDKTHPEERPEKRSQEPNRRNSFTRDQIVRSRPEKGDPILKEYRRENQKILRGDRAGENHSRPIG